MYLQYTTSGANPYNYHIPTYVRTSGDMYIGLPLFYPPSWWPLVADCLLHTICLDSHQTDFLLTAAKREHCHYWICIHTVRIVYIHTNDSLNVSFIVSLTVSSLPRTFFTASSLMTESTSFSNTSASILATSFSDERMVGSRVFSRLRLLSSFWKCKVKTPHVKGAPWQDAQVTKQTYVRTYVL